MRRTTFVLALLLGLLAISPTYAVTVYYQPTPYPLFKNNGAMLPQDLKIVHIWDGYVGSNYSTAFTRAANLTVGGWGDTYDTHIAFDVEGLPKAISNVKLWLWPMPQAGGALPTSVNVNRISTSWKPLIYDTAKMVWRSGFTWFTKPQVVPLFTQIAPLQNQWYGIDITTRYQSWRSSPSSNYGLRLDPSFTNNNFDVFYSSRTEYDGARPILGITFTPPVGMPNFKMPLPSGHSWLVTNEVGGYECKGVAPWPDTAHQGSNYFAIDFSSRTKKGTSYPSINVPVLATASGVVKKVGYASSTGYYITIDHGSGYLTRSIHFDDPAARKNGTPLLVGDRVNQGDQIGLMGNRGDSTGKHLHVNFWYNTEFNGGSSVTNLTYITMDGWLLKSFQTECTMNASEVALDWNRYYASQNTPTGQ